jgi:hypothetical protein
MKSQRTTPIALRDLPLTLVGIDVIAVRSRRSGGKLINGDAKGYYVTQSVIRNAGPRLDGCSSLACRAPTEPWRVDGR